MIASRNVKKIDGIEEHRWASVVKAGVEYLKYFGTLPSLQAPLDIILIYLYALYVEITTIQYSILYVQSTNYELSFNAAEKSYENCVAITTYFKIVMYYQHSLPTAED